MDFTRSTQDWTVFEHLTSNRLGQEELEALAEVIQQGQLTLGPQTIEFETEFAQRIGAAHAVAVNSCTSALNLAAQILDIGPGDEVIVTTQTLWVTAWATAARGATLRFADIEENTLCVDPRSVRALITDRTKAVFVTHFGGYPVDIDPILDAARDKGAFVVEDCAHAPGAVYKGRHVGTLGDIGCFSFGPSKNITCGEGGMFVTNSEVFASAAERLRRYVAVGDRKPRKSALLGKYPPLAYYQDWHAHHPQHDSSQFTNSMQGL